MKLLLVEDSKEVAEIIYDYFEGEQLDYAATGTQGLSLASSNQYDCIILDIMLPGLDGLSVCQQLREQGVLTPIIMLTARDTNQDMLSGLTIGADDYIVKPFDLELLEARIEAVLRRTNRSAFKQSITIGELSLNLTNHQVTRQGKPIQLNPSCFKILKVMMQKHPDIATRDDITNTLWSDDLPDNDVLRKHIYLLRTKVDKGYDFDMIKTIPKVGYKIDHE